MIPAVIDYISYRFGKAHYSQDALSYCGSQLTREALEHFNEVKPGDLIFLHTQNSFLSWLVMYYISSVWCHVATYTGKGFIIHQTIAGVQNDSLAAYCDGKHYFTVYTLKGITPEQRAQVVEILYSQKGKPYNWRTVIRKWFRIITAADYRWVPHFTVDVILLLSLGLIGGFGVLFFIVVFIIIVYLAILAVNLLRRTKKLAKRDNPFNLFGGQYWQGTIFTPDK